MHLAVDTVWRGAVPARLVVETGPQGGGGSCTTYPLPGQRFLVCDSEADDAPPAVSKCDRPALGDHAIADDAVQHSHQRAGQRHRRREERSAVLERGVEGPESSRLPPRTQA